MGLGKGRHYLHPPALGLGSVGSDYSLTWEKAPQPGPLSARGCVASPLFVTSLLGERR